MAKMATVEHFKRWAEKYRAYTDSQLAYARADCHAAALAMPDDAGYYLDESSVIVAEQARRLREAAKQERLAQAHRRGRAARRAYLNR